jgi:16S rRNA U516 pseudouridylate synthase RsuA-like enzyme
VEKLKRVQIGTVNLGSLKPGEFRFLDSVEIAKVRKSFHQRTKPE